jgi:2-oxoisovalerate dehydrogenase E2 component (dihydrolipoyl transacylase)
VVNPANEFKLPDVGEGLTEAELVEWHVKVGDTVKVNDILCDIETAKSVVELPSPYAGVVQALLVPEGETIEVGTPIIRIGESVEVGAESQEVVTEPAAAADGVETSAQVDPPAPAEPVVAADPAEVEQPLTLVGSGPKEAAVSRRPRVLAKPTARALAREQGIDLADVVPARADGVVTTSDLTSAGHETRPASPGAHADGPGDGRLGLHRAARDRVGHRRRHPDDGAGHPAQAAR